MSKFWNDTCKSYQNRFDIAFRLHQIKNVALKEPRRNNDCTGKPLISRGRKSYYTLLVTKQQRQIVALVAKVLREDGWSWELISSFVGGYTFHTIHLWCFQLLKVCVTK